VKFLLEVNGMLVVFERRNGRVFFEVIRGSERDEKMFTKLFDKYGKDMVKIFPCGIPLNLDVYKLKKMLEGRKKKNGARVF